MRHFSYNRSSGFPDTLWKLIHQRPALPAGTMDPVTVVPMSARERAIAGGIQEHSMGDTYPRIVTGIETLDGTRYRLENLQDGTVLAKETVWPTGFFDHVWVRDVRSTYEAMEMLADQSEEALASMGYEWIPEQGTRHTR